MKTRISPKFIKPAFWRSFSRPFKSAKPAAIGTWESNTNFESSKSTVFRIGTNKINHKNTKTGIEMEEWRTTSNQYWLSILDLTSDGRKDFDLPSLSERQVRNADKDFLSCQPAVKIKSLLVNWKRRYVAGKAKSEKTHTEKTYRNGINQAVVNIKSTLISR